MTRYVKWPKYVRIQRQRRVLYERIKIPPSINQFSHTADKNQAAELFKLLLRYRPETRVAKKERLTAAAKQLEESKEAPSSKPRPVVKFGLNHITTLVEQKKAKLVVIAHDVDPIEVSAPLHYE